MFNARLDEAQAGIKIMGRNINNFRYADGTTLRGESKEELKSLLMKVKEESEKAGLKLNIQVAKIMASSPITLWQIDGETMETVTNSDFIFALELLQTVTTAMKLRHLLLENEAMTDLDSILKSRDITMLTKVHLVKAMGFPVVMYKCESWTTKMVEHQRIDAFELQGWRRLLRVPWTARKSNQSTLKEISPEYSLEKTMMLGKMEGRRRRGRQRIRRLDSIIDSIHMGLLDSGRW